MPAPPAPRPAPPGAGWPPAHPGRRSNPSSTRWEHARPGAALEAGNLILEQELAPLQAFHLQLIGFVVHAQARNDVVEVAMLDPELTQTLDVLEQVGIDVALFFVAPGVAFW